MYNPRTYYQTLKKRGELMPDKEPSWLLQIAPMVLAVFLAALGGALQYLNRVDKLGIRFSVLKLLLEVSTSGFVGIISFELCDYAGFNWQLTAALVAISGHMGARALVLLENALIRRYGNERDCKTTVEEEAPGTCKTPSEEKL